MKSYYFFKINQQSENIKKSQNCDEYLLLGESSLKEVEINTSFEKLRTFPELEFTGQLVVGVHFVTIGITSENGKIDQGFFFTDEMEIRTETECGNYVFLGEMTYEESVKYIIEKDREKRNESST